MTPQQLLEAAELLVERMPDAQLVKNDVGNLAVMDGDTYAGWIDLDNGDVKLYH